MCENDSGGREAEVENILKIAADEVREELQNIELRQFFRLLELWVDGLPSAPFKMLDRFRKRGLPITAAAKGYVGDGHHIHAVDITTALIKVRKKYEQNKGHSGFDADAAWESVTVKINGEILAANQKYKKPPGRFFIGDVSQSKTCEVVGASDDYELPIGALWVNESDVKKVCTKIGMDHYYWPVERWPYRIDSIEKRLIESLDADCKQGSQEAPPAPTDNINATHENKGKQKWIADEDLVPFIEKNIKSKLKTAKRRALLAMMIQRLEVKADHHQEYEFDRKHLNTNVEEIHKALKWVAANDNRSNGSAVKAIKILDKTFDDAWRKNIKKGLAEIGSGVKPPYRQLSEEIKNPNSGEMFDINQ